MTNNNIVPALIIAAAIVFVAFIARPNAGRQVDAMFNQIEDAVQRKDAAGKTQLTRIFEGASKSASSGLSAGFENGQSDKAKEELAARDKLSVRNVKLVPAQSKNQERVIGTVKNDGIAAVADVRLNVSYYDKAGELIDVSSTFSSVQGVIKPGEELAFEVSRTIGEFNAKDDFLAAHKASSAKIAINGLRLMK
jgi:hypothetical protein